MEVRHTQLIEKSEGKHSADLKEISKSVQKTLEIISLLSETVSNTMEIYAYDSQLQLKEINKVKEQIASVTVSLQKQMSLLQMDIRSALTVASANQVVTKDYLKVIIDNQKEAYKLFRLIGANSGNRKMEVILQQHSPSPIPQLPIAVKEGEVSYIPSHLNLTNLILEAQQRNPENLAQLLSSSGLDGTEFIGTVVDHFSNDAQSEERRENLRRIKELCGNMKGISEMAGGENFLGCDMPSLVVVDQAAHRPAHLRVHHRRVVGRGARRVVVPVVAPVVHDGDNLTDDPECCAYSDRGEGLPNVQEGARIICSTFQQRLDPTGGSWKSLSDATVDFYWREFQYWKSPKFLASSKQNKKNRRGGDENAPASSTHTGGPLSFRETQARLGKSGKASDLYSPYTHTHIRRNMMERPTSIKRQKKYQ
ncbi:unnamed protein product [Cuscuta campestris]|uniref:Uncharacterized protein n=1 Tax=Cuscuta campestris TaxID=132261 RepID=A0A484LTQ2_9ASTE|nr:unnamed protein product [Cuscuta campestris]